MAGFDDILDALFPGRKQTAAPPQKSLDERWTDYINDVQNGPTQTTQPSNNPLAALSALFGGNKNNNNQGFGQPGPPSPVDYGRMRSILNSGVLRKPTPEEMEPGTPSPVVQQQPAPAQAKPIQSNPLQAFLALFGR